MADDPSDIGPIKTFKVKIKDANTGAALGAIGMVYGPWGTHWGVIVPESQACSFGVVYSQQRALWVVAEGPGEGGLLGANANNRVRLFPSNDDSNAAEWSTIEPDGHLQYRWGTYTHLLTYVGGDGADRNDLYVKHENGRSLVVADTSG